MEITCISDLHGFYPKLDGGDLLIIAGDITARDKITEWNDFYHWLDKQNYEKKVYIGGNHDNFLTNCCSSSECIDLLGPHECCKYEFLYDSGSEFGGFKIWGTPWTKTFEGMNPKCKAFTVDTEEELAEKFALIPDNIDILITHSPPHGILDKVEDYETGKIKNVGSTALSKNLCRINPKLHVFGHIHESYGEVKPLYNDIKCKIHFVNASQVNQYYRNINKPFQIIVRK